MPLTRRQILALVGVGGGAGLLLARDGEARTVRTTCRLCAMHCGLIATVRDGELVEIGGDAASKTRGFTCLQARTLPDVLVSSARVPSPLRRAGASFAALSWGSALEEIAAGLARVAERHGPEAIAVQTGWPLVRHPLVPWLDRFCRAVGTPNLITVASVCEAAGRMGKSLTAGTNFWPDVRQARTLIVWGANPPVSAPPFARAIHSFAKKGRHLIVVDPVRTPLAAKAELHLQVRPGTDGALALAMMHVLIAEDLVAKAFVAENATGYDALARLVETFPPERAEAITGVSRELITRAAILFAREGPATIWDGLGIEHHDNGLQTVRAVACLQALAGYVGADGGARPWALLPPRATPEPVPPPPKARPIGIEEHPLYARFNQQQAQGNLLTPAILDGEPYPVRALILIGSNPAVTSPGAARMAEALRKLDLLVVLDPFLSATCEHAHFVLPAATFAEGESPWAGDIEVTGPHGGAWPDWKIVFELARAMGLGPYFPWRTFREASAAPVVPIDREAVPATGGRWPTPSGKIELESSLLAAAGQDGLPAWTPPSEPTTPEFPLRLITGPRTPWAINSQGRSVPELRSRMPAPGLRLHPETARRARVADGTKVRVVTAHGALEIVLATDEAVHPEAAVLPAGWPEASANLLTSGRARDPITGFPALRATPCRVEPLPG